MKNVLQSFLTFLLSALYVTQVHSADNNCAKLLSEINFPGLTHINESSDGSTGGQWFSDATGKRWYLKRDVVHEELQTSAEVMGSLVYRHFGYATPEIKKMVIEGKHYVAIADIGSGTERTRFDEMNTSSVRRMRVVAAFIADYDRIGNKSNNRLNADGSFTLIDFGGAFGSKARGQHKPGEVFSPAIGSFSGDVNIYDIMDSVPLRYFTKDRARNQLITEPIEPNHPWRLLNEQDSQFVVEQMKELTDAKIRSIVTAAGYSNDSDRDFMIQSLIGRRDTIVSDLVKEFLPNLESGEVSFSKRYADVDALEVQESTRLTDEEKLRIYQLQSEVNVSTYSRTAVWRILGNLDIEPAFRKELFLNSLRRESAAIYGLSVFPKGEIADDFVQQIYATLLESNFQTGHYLSTQEGDEHLANTLGSLIGELRSHGLQYIAESADGTKLIEATKSDYPSREYQVVFPGNSWASGPRTQPGPYEISRLIECGQVRLRALNPLR